MKKTGLFFLILMVAHLGFSQPATFRIDANKTIGENTQFFVVLFGIHISI